MRKSGYVQAVQERARADSNGRPLAPEASALSTELRAQNARFYGVFAPCRLAAALGCQQARRLAHELAAYHRSTLRDTPRAMAEESTTPDLVELTRHAIDASQRGDYDAIMGLFAPNFVWESLDGLAVFEGATAVRRFLEDFRSSYESFDSEPEARAAAERLAESRG